MLLVYGIFPILILLFSNLFPNDVSALFSNKLRGAFACCLSLPSFLSLSSSIFKKSNLLSTGTVVRLNDSFFPTLWFGRWNSFLSLIGRWNSSFLLCLRIVKSFCRYYCLARWFVLFFFDLVGEMVFVGIFYLSIILVVVVVVVVVFVVSLLLIPYQIDDFESWAIFSTSKRTDTILVI